ncbi:MAG: T9SS type A sorting domain-containing protein [Ignavibacteriales bacterium]|nr:MAG: T9SS type A sorting domain-containing protein [Ignavibacteriales bacterium]
MRKFVFRAMTTLLFAFFLFANANAQLLVEDFNFTGLLTNNGWSVTSGGGTQSIETTAGLSYTGYPGSGVGNAAGVDNNGEDVNKQFATLTSGTVYYSSLLNVSNAVAGYFLHLGTGTSAFAARIFVQPSTTAGKINFGFSNSSTATYSTTDFDPSTTYLLIVKYEVSTTGNASMWIIPSGIPADETSAGTALLTATGSGQATISGIYLRQYNASQNITVDGIRAGTSWTDLFPVSGSPILSASPSSLSGFTYVVGSGPSSSQSYNLSGSDLDPASGNITVTGSTNYEVSTDDVSFSSSVNVAYTGGALSSTPIYVRLKSGLSYGLYNGENVTNSGGMATTQDVTCNGEVISSLPITENFNYTTGSNLTDNGWIAHSGAGNLPIMVNSSPLTYSGYVNSGLGKSVALTAPDTLSAEDDKRVFSNVTSGSVYASFMVNVSSVTDSSVYYLHFGEGNSTSLFFAKVFIKNNGSNFAFGVAKRNNSDAVFTASSYSLNTTYLLVVKYTFNSGTTTDDEVKLWVNPALNGTEPASDLTQTDGGTDANDISFLALRQGAFGPALSFGGLRVATTWLPAAPGGNFSVSYLIQAGWNLVSFPGIHPNSMDRDTLYRFRDPAADVFWFDGAMYVAENPLSVGKAYWMRHGAQRLYNWNGTVQSGVLYPQLSQATVVPFAGVAGWNLVGAYDYTAQVNDLTTSPSGLINGFPFSYSPGFGYQPASSLQPSYGYFVNMTGAGDIIFPPRPSAPPKLNNEEIFKSEWAKIIIKDAEGKQYTLYATNGNAQLEKFILPPKPPVGLFDVRFTTDKMVEDLSTEKTFELSGVEYPVTISVSGMNASIKDAVTGQYVNTQIMDGNQIVISNSAVNKLTISTDVVAPVEYQLAQNYPNPFNPSTTIKFSLAKDGFVTLKIYDAIGNEVSTLVNEQRQQGNYEIDFSALSLSSGVYFYKIQSGEFTATRKMLLLK